MPAFTFEKISAPARAAAVSPSEHHGRGGIVQILGRFVGTRVQRTESESQDRNAPTRGAHGNVDRRKPTLPK